ncbi:MAG: hypothetical protein RI988_2001 [Pseudomonadota bacterium]
MGDGFDMARIVLRDPPPEAKGEIGGRFGGPNARRARMGCGATRLGVAQTPLGCGSAARLEHRLAGCALAVGRIHRGAHAVELAPQALQHRGLAAVLVPFVEFRAYSLQ